MRGGSFEERLYSVPMLFVKWTLFVLPNWMSLNHVGNREESFDSIPSSNMRFRMETDLHVKWGFARSNLFIGINLSRQRFLLPQPWKDLAMNRPS